MMTPCCARFSSRSSRTTTPRWPTAWTSSTPCPRPGASPAARATLRCSTNTLRSSSRRRPSWCVNSATCPRATAERPPARATKEGLRVLLCAHVIRARQLRAAAFKVWTLYRPAVAIGCFIVGLSGVCWPYTSPHLPFCKHQCTPLPPSCSTRAGESAHPLAATYPSPRNMPPHPLPPHTSSAACHSDSCPKTLPRPPLLCTCLPAPSPTR